MPNRDDREQKFREFANFSYESAPVQKINLFTALKNWNNWHGRARRKEYWLFMLLTVIASAVATILEGGEQGIISALVTLFLFIPSLSVSIRRLHDTDHSAWWLLLLLLPVLGNCIIFIFMLLDSQPGPNRYGENPKGIS